MAFVKYIEMWPGQFEEILIPTIPRYEHIETPLSVSISQLWYI